MIGSGLRWRQGSLKKIPPKKEKARYGPVHWSMVVQNVLAEIKKIYMH